MIVDGLGHVSLDSGAPGSALANNTLSQANIHQGKIKDTFKYVMIFYSFYRVTSQCLPKCRYLKKFCVENLFSNERECLRLVQNGPFLLFWSSLSAKTYKNTVKINVPRQKLLYFIPTTNHVHK